MKYFQFSGIFQKMIFIKVVCIAILGIELSGCTKFVQAGTPVTLVTGATVYANNTSASAAMTGIYNNLVANPGFPSGYYSVGLLEAMAADEMTNYGYDPVQIQFYTNGLSSNSGSDPGWWAQFYQQIYAANAVLEGLSSSSGVSPAMKSQLTGEASFMRAFLHFYATSLYGDVPLVLSTKYTVNESAARTPRAQVYAQVIADLKQAENLLGDDFLDPSGKVTQERVRPNKAAASAMLSRAYLYTGNFDSAIIEASAVIGNSNYNLDSLNDVFLANSTESIWQLQAISPGTNTWDAPYMVLSSAPGTGDAPGALSSYLVNAFEPGDSRFQNWVGGYTNDSVTFYYYPYKYKVWIDDPTIPVTEYTTVLRLAEQYLIRAEARAQTGDIQGAQSDLNVIRTRAWLPNTIANDKQSLLAAVLHERQIELFSEWGHRWFDLIRTETINSVMGSPGNVCSDKGGAWSENWTILPIPSSEILLDKNLKQNPGY